MHYEEGLPYFTDKLIMAVPAGVLLVVGVAVLAVLGNFALHKVEEGERSTILSARTAACF